MVDSIKWEIIQWDAEPITLVGKLVEVKPDKLSSEIWGVLAVPDQKTRVFDESNPKSYVLVNVFDPDRIYVKKELEGKWVEISLDYWGGWITRVSRKQEYYFNPRKELIPRRGRIAVVKLVVKNENVFLNFKFFRLQLTKAIVYETKKGPCKEITLKQLENLVGKEKFVEVEFTCPWPKLGVLIKVLE